MPPTVRPDLQMCHRCGFETTESFSQCLRCGGELQTAVQIRRQGRRLVWIGVLLIALMGVVVAFVTHLVLAPALPAGFPRITETPDILAATYAALLLPLAFGFACVWKGAAQWRSGRPSLRLLTLGLGIGVVLLSGAALLLLLR